MCVCVALPLVLARLRMKEADRISACRPASQSKKIQTDKRMDRHTHRRTARQTGRQAGRQTDRQTNKQTSDFHTDKQTDRHMIDDTQTHRHEAVKQRHRKRKSPKV